MGFDRSTVEHRGGISNRVVGARAIRVHDYQAGIALAGGPGPGGRHGARALTEA